MQTVAVTGSSGFIGRHLVRALLKENYQVIEIDLDKGLDISNWEEAARIPAFDVIVHLAAKSFVPDSFARPREFYSVNQATTLNAMELARINKARVIYFSSYLYGAPEYLPVDEKHPLAPHNPYAQSKLICEKICEGYHRDFNVPVVIFRPFNIYGPGQNTSFLIPRIINQAKTGIISLQDPRPKRDFIYVDDVIRAVLLAINYNKSELEVFNLGSGCSVSVEEVLNKIVKILGKSDLEICFSNEARQNEVLDCFSDISKAKELLNWVPIYSLEQGLISMGV